MSATAKAAEGQHFHQLYRAHHGWLLGWLRHRLPCRDTAEDLAQDTFLRVLTARERETIEEPRAFLTVIAQRLVASHYRRRSLEHAYLDALAQLPETVAPSPETRLLALETLVEVDRLLDGLSFRAKKAFLLARIDGRPYADIAAELGVSVISVKKYMAAAAQRCYFAASGEDR